MQENKRGQWGSSFGFLMASIGSAIGLGNLWGSLIAAAALTVLPELLRAFSDYRMLVYAIVLILVMLATNNPTLKTFFSRFKLHKPTGKEAV